MPAIENHVSFRTELGAAELSATLGDSDRDRNAKEDAEHTAEQAVAERVRRDETAGLCRPGFGLLTSCPRTTPS
jgi:hypothetical protein